MSEPTVIPADAPPADSVPVAPPAEDAAPSLAPTFSDPEDNGNIEPAGEVVPFGTPITSPRIDGQTFFSRTYTVPSLDHDIENLRNAFRKDVGEGFTFNSIRVDVTATYGDVEETDNGLEAAPTFAAVVEGIGAPIEAPIPFQP